MRRNESTQILGELLILFTLAKPDKWSTFFGVNLNKLVLKSSSANFAEIKFSRNARPPVRYNRHCLIPARQCFVSREDAISISAREGRR